MKARGYYWAHDRQTNTRAIVMCDGCGIVWHFGHDSPEGEAQFKARGRRFGPRVRRTRPRAGESLQIPGFVDGSGYYWETYFEEPVYVRDGEIWQAGHRGPTDPQAFDFLADVHKVDVWSDLELGLFEK